MSEAFDKAGGILLYGAYGYTGRLTAQLAATLGIRVTLAGRDEARLRAMAEQYGFRFHTVALEDALALQRTLREFSTVLHMAGPFVRTSRPMLDACLAVRTNYLDVTGEIEVFEALWRRTGEIEAAGITVIPGIGFDVVPTDCLAAYVAAQVDAPEELTITVDGFAGVSRGTMRTMLESIDKIPVCRRGGKLVPWRGPAVCKLVTGSNREMHNFVPVPWGDLSTAYRSTGAANITSFLRQTGALRLAASLRWALGPLLRTGVGRTLARKLLKHVREGPTAEQRAKSQANVTCFVADQHGRSAAATLVTPDPYEFTAHSALRAAQSLAQVTRPLGLVTPAQAFGPDWVLSLPNCFRSDLSHTEFPACASDR